jgi:hypothetical protein
MTAMTAMPTLPATASRNLVWPVAVPAEEAVRKVARRLPEQVPLAAHLYHHPFVGLVFVCRPPARRALRRGGRAPVLGHVVVDLVAGRAFLSDPWDEDSFVTREAALEAVAFDADPVAPSVRGPAPRITETEAVEAARALLAGVLVRRRRLDPVGRAELHAPPVYFGKPNWWVTGKRGERAVEVVVDALNGRHYACSG